MFNFINLRLTTKFDINNMTQVRLVFLSTDLCYQVLTIRTHGPFMGSGMSLETLVGLFKFYGVLCFTLSLVMLKHATDFNQSNHYL